MNATAPQSAASLTVADASARFEAARTAHNAAIRAWKRGCRDNTMNRAFEDLRDAGNALSAALWNAIPRRAA